MNLARNGGIAIDLDSGLLVRNPGGSGGSGGGSGSAGAVTFYTCVSVDASSKTWSGQRWEWQETGYVKLDAVTEGLTFGNRYTPVAGQIYNAEATVRATILCHKQGVVPEGAVFHASLCALMETAESGQALTLQGPAPEEVTEDGIPCLKFSGSSILKFPDSGLPMGQNPFTVSAWAKMSPGAPDAIVFGYGNLGTEAGGCTICLRDGQVTDVGGCGYDHGCDLPSGKSATAWHHYAIRWDGTYSRICVDGALLSTMDRSGRNMSQYNGAIGGSHSWGDCFSGFIAAARIYDTALDEGGILSLAGEFNPLSAG